MAIKYTEVKCTVADAISNGFTDLSDLADEMSEWRDNMEEKLSNTSKYQEVSDCVDQLDNCRDDPTSDLPEALSSLPVTYSVGSKRKEPRWLRRDNAVAAIQAAKDALEEFETEDSDLKESAEDAASKLENAIGEAEAAEFPGMY